MGVQLPDQGILVNIIAVAGRIDQSNLSGKDRKSSFALEFDLQGLVDILLLHAVLNNMDTKRWRYPLIAHDHDDSRKRRISARLNEEIVRSRKNSTLKDDNCDLPSSSDVNTGNENDSFGTRSPNKGAFGKKFILLPVSSPIDAIQWIDAVLSLYNSRDPMNISQPIHEEEFQKMKCHYKSRSVI